MLGASSLSEKASWLGCALPVCAEYMFGMWAAVTPASRFSALPSNHVAAVSAPLLLLLLQALGFAGPSYIPKDPGSLWCCAVHRADVLFFWDAAENWGVSEVRCTQCVTDCTQ